MSPTEDAIYDDLADVAGMLKKLDRNLALIWTQTRGTALRETLDGLPALSGLDLLSARKEVETLLAEHQAGHRPAMLTASALDAAALALTLASTAPAVRLQAAE